LKQVFDNEENAHSWLAAQGLVPVISDSPIDVKGREWTEVGWIEKLDGQRVVARVEAPGLVPWLKVARGSAKVFGAKGFTALEKSLASYAEKVPARYRKEFLEKVRASGSANIGSVYKDFMESLYVGGFDYFRNGGQNYPPMAASEKSGQTRISLLPDVVVEGAQIDTTAFEEIAKSMGEELIINRKSLEAVVQLVTEKYPQLIAEGMQKAVSSIVFPVPQVDVHVPEQQRDESITKAQLIESFAGYLAEHQGIVEKAFESQAEVIAKLLKEAVIEALANLPRPDITVNVPESEITVVAPTPKRKILKDAQGNIKAEVIEEY